MGTVFGLHFVDLSVVVLYFVGITAFGLWMSRRVKTEEDYFLGGRKFGKSVLIFHWLCTGTHTDNPVQVSGATFRVGLGGIWYQWMWLFCTPFYWLIAPLTRRLRYVTTGEFFRDRYSPGLERLYALIGITFYVMTIAQVMLGAGNAISGATAGQVGLGHAVVALSVISLVYVMAGGLVAAAYTDVVQGVLIIVLSVLLIPFGLRAAGGGEALAAKLAVKADMLSIVAPPGAREGTLFFVAMMSLLSLVGIVVQPHTLTATGSAKTEFEARMGMCYGNFVKRVLTIAWAFTGIIGFALFADQLTPDTSDQVWGLSSRHLPLGFRGLMVAAMLAGVTACETYMVVGSSIFTVNFYGHVRPGHTDAHYLLVGRLTSAAMLLAGIAVAFEVPSLSKVLKMSMEVIAFMGAAFWVGIAWRRANAWGAWAGTVGAFVAWLTMLVLGCDTPARVALFVPVEFGLLILVSLLTPRPDAARLDRFFARLHTSVASEATGGFTLDPNRPKLIRHPDFELPRPTLIGMGGFILAWGIVAGLILLLLGLARLAG